VVAEIEFLPAFSEVGILFTRHQLENRENRETITAIFAPRIQVLLNPGLGFSAGSKNWGLWKNKQTRWLKITSS
jgi:hypothetical protein